MKKDIINRNIERLIYSDFQGEKEPMEPMSAWKWNKVWRIARKYGIEAWLADGIRRYEDDFFLNIPEDIKQQFLDCRDTKDAERLDRYQLETDRRLSWTSRFSMHSLKTYTRDLISTIKNIEE